jgi:DNA-binding MarR family transcriptional regulator
VLKVRGGLPSGVVAYAFCATISCHDMPRRLSDTDYQRLLAFRTSLRRFLRWSERQARAQGLTPAQHQLLLAIRGHPHPRGPSIGEVADYLLLRHHSAVGLVDRAAATGLVERKPDAERPGTVRLALTSAGAQRLDALTVLHIEELTRLARSMHPLSRGLDENGPAESPVEGRMLT